MPTRTTAKRKPSTNVRESNAKLALRPKTTALATVPAKSNHATLTKTDKALLAEALRRAEAARNVVESTLLDFGRWVLVEVFQDDAAAALGDRKRDNPVWREMLSRAGGSTLRLGTRFLYVSLEIAAHDKRIQDDSWRLLEPGRKELLLPLRDETLMRKAARRVVEMKLSQRATRALVKAELASRGENSVSRVTPKTFQNQVHAFREKVGETSYRRKLEASLSVLSKSKRVEMRKELEALHRWAADLISTLR
jgi:hypothetical protein